MHDELPVSVPKGDSIPVDLRARRIDEAAAHIADALRVMGIFATMDAESQENTPHRVARSWTEFFAGCNCDPSKHLDRWFEPEGNEIVLIRDIPFTSMCGHHLVPFVGKAHIAYIPNERMAGISKFARLLEEFARRPQVQERLTTQIADVIMDKLEPLGCAVVIEAEHLCMTTRGVLKPGSQTVTSAMRGMFKDDPKARGEVMSLIDSGRR